VRREQSLIYIPLTLKITIPDFLNPFILCQSSASQNEEISPRAALKEAEQAIDMLIASVTSTRGCWQLNPFGNFRRSQVFQYK
jgi:hypothetical protein